jgi:hypothetical protein
LEALEDRQLLSTSSLVFPGPGGHLTYVPDAQGNIIPDFFCSIRAATAIGK